MYINFGSNVTSNLFQIFLCAAIRTTALHQQEQQRAAPVNGDRPSVLPVLINDRLCTVEQDQWWNTAYQLFKNTAKYVLFVCNRQFIIVELFSEYISKKLQQKNYYFQGKSWEIKISSATRY